MSSVAYSLPAVERGSVLFSSTLCLYRSVRALGLNASLKCHTIELLVDESRIEWDFSYSAPLSYLFPLPRQFSKPPGFSLDLDPVLDLFHSFCIGMLICLSADPTFLYIVLPWIALNS